MSFKQNKCNFITVKMDIKPQQSFTHKLHIYLNALTKYKSGSNFIFFATVHIYLIIHH